jgi:hypothetical protein
VNDAVSCLMRVLDVHAKSFSFSEISRRFRAMIRTIYDQEKIDKTRISHFRERLMEARRKLHFHMDKEYASDPDLLRIVHRKGT